MILGITHTTRYRYDPPLVGESFMEVRLRPLTIPDVQSCREFTLTTEPVAAIFEYSKPDQRGTVHHFIVRDKPYSELAIHATSVVATLQSNPFADVQLLNNDWPMVHGAAFHNDFAEWLAPTEVVPLEPIWAGPETGKESVFQYGQDLSDLIHSSFDYVPGTTEVSTPLDVFVKQGRGVCQDYAHLMLSIARSAGVPARYVSGYIYSGSRPGTLGADAMHAWVELYLPEDRIWKGFDPTNNIVVGDAHVKIAVGRDYSDVPPTKGLVRAIHGNALPATFDLEVEVQVQRMDDHG